MNNYNGNKNFKIDIPKNAAIIIKILEQNGFEAFAVGGCVRDTILGKEPQDWDITTSALPRQIKEIFHKTIDTGIKHGTVTVRIGGQGYEVTTYRIDGEYLDSRHPQSVEFTKSLIEDLKRRDFTINAMAYNPREGLVDVFDGKKDLEDKIIRCVGEPEERFDEDALRILRAVRFCAQLGFEIDKSTMDAMSRLSPSLKNISAERIRTELEKLITSDHPEKLTTAYKLGVTKQVLPEFDAMEECPQITPYHCYNVGDHTIKVMQNVRPDRVMRWAALFHDAAKPDCLTYDKKQPERTHFYGHAQKGAVKAGKVMRRLRLDNKTIKTVCRLIECHDDRPTKKGCEPEIVRRSVNKIGKDIYAQYIELAYADFQGKSEYGRQAGYAEFEYLREQYEIIAAQNICTSVKEMNITGAELIELGCPKGPEVGDVLDDLLEEVLKNPQINTNEKLREEAEKIINK